MNSRTSRPRSPIRPTTTASQSAFLASMESSTDLPTPEPAKTPRRWPRQQVVKTFMARTPRSSRSPTRPRAWAGGGGGAQRIGGEALRQRALAVDRVAEGVDDAAEPGQGRAHGRAPRLDADLGAGRHALDRAERHQQRAGVAEADHLGRQRLFAEADDLGAGADRQPRQPAAGLDQQAVHRRHAAGDRQGIDPLDRGHKTLQEQPSNSRPQSSGDRA